MIKHTWDDKEMMKKAMKNKKRNPKKMRKTISTMSIQKGSQFISVCVFQTYMIEDIKCCLELFSKKIFSDANPFYQSHLSIARKHKNN